MSEVQQRLRFMAMIRKPLDSTRRLGMPRCPSKEDMAAACMSMLSKSVMSCNCDIILTRLLQRSEHELLFALENFKLEALEGHGRDIGKLAPVPRYQHLPILMTDAAERLYYVTIHEAIDKLGRAMQMGQHRHLIDCLDNTLSCETLTTMTSLAWKNPEACAALAVYLTTLEQAYHWPRDASVATPLTLEDHKLVIQMLNQPQLRIMLRESLQNDTSLTNSAITPNEIARKALYLARLTLDVARLAQKKNLVLSRDIQDMVNLLYRTCRSDWGDQGDYNDISSHREFGRLHEVVRASGTQRRMQDLFEQSGGIQSLQVMAGLLDNLPSSSIMLSDILIQLQFAVAVVREELFTVSVDEVIWGRVFANFSKAVGFSDISAGGGDAPVFWMLDSLCDQANPEQHATLPGELDFRSRFFPPNMRALFDNLRGLPTLRGYCNSTMAPEPLKQSFKALECQRFELYEMHRKKAARIVLSLRSGQRGTSAGATGCPYATPEKSIATTLNAAMTARFGADDTNRLIGARAQSHSLMFDENGNVYSARVRFDFDTSLVVGPGDCLLVKVQLPDGVWRTRTFSVTYTHKVHQPLEHDAHHIVGAAEVYVRSKGLVSAYLCDQTQGCKVRVAVKPASHFRLVPNSNALETTVFVAQGGALGIFLAWLESQKHFNGHYVLVVASQRYAQLGFKKELLRIANNLKQCLQVVVVLSRPDGEDVSTLQSANIHVYCGRANQYFNDYELNDTKAFYICGTSSFGLDVAKSISVAQGDDRYPKRLEPIISSHLPPVRLHVAPEAQTIKALPIISPAELAQHNSPADLWIAVGDNVYDITALSKFHPGGEKILMARAGRQAQDLFESVHGGSVDVESLLHNMMIGQLGSADKRYSAWEERLDKVVEIQNDVTNHSRFEKLPKSSTDDLSETPPTHVIYASVECFSRDWCTLLQEINLSKTKQCHLMRAWLGLKRALDGRQAGVYDKFSNDTERCRHVVQYVFDSLRTVAAEMHAALDNVKAKIATCISDGSMPNCEIFEACTDHVIEVISNQTRAATP